MSPHNAALLFVLIELVGGTFAMIACGRWPTVRTNAEIAFNTIEAGFVILAIWYLAGGWS
jgi:hypothetical protein